MVACKVGKIGTVIFLMEEGADGNLRNEEGITAFNHAKMNGKRDIMTYLTECGKIDIPLISNIVSEES